MDKQTPLSQPAKFIVLEFHGTGDPMFGGKADDRALGKDGKFLTGTHRMSDVAEFASKDEALASAERASNRRAAGKLASWERA